MSYGSAVKYGYSNTRVKAMEAKLIKSQEMQGIAAAKSINDILPLLIQTDYSQSLADYGGIDIGHSLIDFALSRNMAGKLEKVLRITPKEDRHIMQGITGRWGIGNMRIAIEAKARGLSFDDISKYIIDYGGYNQAFINEAMREPDVAGLLARLEKNPEQAASVKAALSAYSSSKSVVSAIEGMEHEYHKSTEGMAESLRAMGEVRAAEIVCMGIDMSNLLMLVKAKQRGLQFSDVEPKLLRNGGIERTSLRAAYAEHDVASMLSRQHAFNLAKSIDMYKEKKRLLPFEIEMRNSIFSTSLKYLRRSVLSFGAILAYVYLKEIEVFTLRILIKSKEYGLSSEEISRLIEWKI